MRRRLVVSTIAIVLVVLGALAVPVGIVVYNSAERELEAELHATATEAAQVVASDRAAGAELRVALIDTLLGPNEGFQLLGPSGDVMFALRTDGLQPNHLAEYPIGGGEVVRVVSDAALLDDQYRTQLGVLLLLALGALLAAAGLAAVQGRQLGRPLERLASRAGRLGEGDFSTRVAIRTDIPEINDIAQALDSSAARVDALLANERHFTADATHQLRTGIAGMAMRIELLTMHPDAEIADEARILLQQADQLNATIDDLLALARNRTLDAQEVFDLYQMVEEHIEEWRPRYAAARRRLTMVVMNPSAPVYGTKGLAGQVLDIMIDNALVHGLGTVTLTIDGASVLCGDDGPGISDERAATLFDGPVDAAARHGRGLALARRLAQVDGGSVVIEQTRPLVLRHRLVRGHTHEGTVS